MSASYLPAGIVSLLLFSTGFVALIVGLPWTVTSQDDDGILDIGYMQRVDSLNPLVGLTDSSEFFYGLVYDGLMSVDEDLQPAPNLALEWWMVPESDPAMVISGEPYGSVWEYNLTTNANWTDGEPFTSADVVYTINLNALYYTTLWSYQPYTYFMDFAEAVDDYTVRVHFADRSTGDPIPCAYGGSLYMPILPEHLLSTMTAVDIAFGWDGTFAGSSPPIVGTGPFMPTADVYDEFLGGDAITLVKNEYYHGYQDFGKDISFDGLTLRFYDDQDSMMYFLESGVLDVATFPPSTYLELRWAVGSGEVGDIFCADPPKPNQYWTEVTINMNDAGPNPARLDPVVRTAMALATNKTRIVEDFYLGLGTEGSTLISPVSDYWHYEPSFNESFRYNLDNATNFLEVGGYEYTVESPTVRVATADSWAVQQGLVAEGTPLEFQMLIRMDHPEEYEVATYLQSEWGQVGIAVHLTVVDEATLSTLVYSYTYDTAIWYWSSDPDPNYMLFCESSYAVNGWNDNMYMDAEYDENYTASVSALDPVERKAHVDACQLIHYWDIPYIILAYPDQTYAWRTDTFAGWGDWSLPGRTLDNYWGANPVLFDLEVLVDVPDTTPPATECEVTGTEGFSGWYTSDLTVEFSAEDAEGTVACTNYSLDGGSWTVFDDPFEISGDGEHTLEFYSVDDSGNIEETKEMTFNLDTVAPGAVECLLDGNNTFDESWYASSVTVTLTAPEDETSGTAATMYKVGSSMWASYVGPFPIDNEGMHNVSFYCTDAAGNDGGTSYIDIWIDTSDPTVVIDSPIAGTDSDSRDVTVEFTVDDETSGVEAIRVLVDEGDWVDVDPSLDNYTVEDLSDGIHTITVWARDNAGNDASMQVTITVDASSNTTTLYIAGGVVVLAVVALIALLLMKRKGMFKK